MRFYNSEDDTDRPVTPEEIFPKASQEEGARRLLKMGWVPSVTTVLSVIRQEYLEKWRIREAIKDFKISGNPWQALENQYTKGTKESQFGDEVHNTIHKWVQGEQPTPGQVWQHALPAVAYLQENMQEAIFSEKTLCSKQLRTAGTIDLLYKDKEGKLVLADMKVVKFRREYPLTPPINYRAQLSIYAKILEEYGYVPDKRVSLYLASPFGDLLSPRLEVIPYKQDYMNTFLAARTLWEIQYGLDREHIEIDLNKQGEFTP